MGFFAQHEDCYRALGRKSPFHAYYPAPLP
jgi:hypothetical protein